MDFCELYINLKLRSLATIPLLMTWPDSSWIGRYEFSKSDLRWNFRAALCSSDFLSFGCCFLFDKPDFSLPKPLRRSARVMLLFAHRPRIAPHVARAVRVAPQVRARSPSCGMRASRLRSPACLCMLLLTRALCALLPRCLPHSPASFRALCAHRPHDAAWWPMRGGCMVGQLMHGLHGFAF